MARQITLWVAVLQFLFLLAPLIPAYGARIILCNKTDRHALLGFKSGLKLKFGEGKVLPDWNKSTDCCQWAGIACNSRGNVIALNMSFASVDLFATFNPVTKYLPRLKSLQLLDLSYVRISQTFPIELAQLPELKSLFFKGSRIWSTLPDLGNFTKLEALDLGENKDLEGNLHGLCQLRNLNYLSMSYTSVSGIIPRCFGDISNLKYLDLSRQALNGKIPEQLGQLSSLVHLDLSSNNFGQKVTPQLCNLTKLQYLNLGRNEHLTGNIPACFGGLSEVTELTLDGCALNGEIPSSLSKLSKLQRLDLSGNNFIGSIPASIGSLSDLQYLHLSGPLGGVIPESLGNLGRLSELAFDSLDLTGGFPKSFTNLQSLKSLQIFGSSNLTGSLPAVDKLTKLTSLSIRSTGISGSIPDAIGRCYQLEVLDLSSNSLSGAVPKVLGSLSKVTIINLGNNKLSGSIPLELSKLQNLATLKMPSNQLSGEIPAEIGKIFHLTDLDLSSNSLSGNLPAELGNLFSLSDLNLSNNSLTGSIPASFGRLSNLDSMDISYNKLSGPLPEIKSTPSKLRILSLQNNGVTGRIPPWLVNTTKPISVLNLANNQLSSDIPTIPSSSSVDLHGNKLQGTIRFNFTVDWDVVQNFVFYIDLSENEFTSIEYTGDRPDAGADSFSPLQFLSLAGNKIEGKIPGFIGTRMNEFQTLDLSRNQFFGEIPSVFVNLTQLTSFNVSNNHLSGKIPQGGVINNFSRSAFENNDGLCGPPLPDCK